MPPTARETSIYEAALRLKSYEKVAAEVGCPLGSVSSAIRLYRRKTGAPPPIAVRGPSVEHPDLAEIEARVVALERRADDLTTAIKSIGRQLVPAPVVRSHRRIADGGHHR